MDKPAQPPPGPHPATTSDPNPSDNNYVSPASPPPGYAPPHHHQHTPGPQSQGYEMPKYGSPPDPNAGGGYYNPQQPHAQQSFPQGGGGGGGGPQNFAPYGTPLPALGPHPAPIECPDCHARGVTAVEYTSGGFTHALAAIVCFVSCLGCIPYFFTSLKDARHKCAKCGIPLATYHRSGRTEVHWHGAYNG